MTIACVTGASGFLGRTLVGLLVDRGTEVRALYGSQTRGLEGLGIDLRQVGLDDADRLADAFRGTSVVYHLAAKITIDKDRDGSVWKTNVGGARNVAEAARRAGVQRLVHCSSLHAYSPAPTDQTVDETREPARPSDPIYNRSKAAGEAAALEAAGDELDVVIVQPTGILGPGDVGASRIGIMLHDLYHGRLPG
ncbi:MAG: NAD-dependent epimerase/dehydratase family protein, partial [Planctomycetota bacterium]